MSAGVKLKILHFFPCSRVFADKEAMMAGAMEMAAEIAARSPVAVQGTKIHLLYSRDHSVAEGLDYMVTHSQLTSPRMITTLNPNSIPGCLEHEYASDRRRDEISSGRHGEEKPKDSSFRQAMRTCMGG